MNRTTLKLATLPLQLICQLLGSGQPGINENGDLVLDDIRTHSPPMLPNGYVEFQDIRTAYKFSSENATWTEARKICISEGGRLAIVDNVRKIGYIKSLDGANGTWIHVGIHSLFDGEWVRVDNGLPVTYIPWAPNNPDGSGSCVGIHIKHDGLADYACGAKARYVCEIPNE